MQVSVNTPRGDKYNSYVSVYERYYVCELASFSLIVLIEQTEWFL